MRFSIIGIMTLLVAVAFAPLDAQAHKVNVFAYAESGKVYAQCYFADGGPCVGSKVTALGPTGKVVAEGVTDAEGGCIFDIPGPGELKVVLHAGEGHGNEYTLKAEEIAEALGTGAKAPVMENATGAPAPATAQSAPSALPAPEVTSPAYMDTDEETMRRIVSEELDKKMKPVNRQLMDIKAAMENPTLSDTLSGIGYIFGLLGIILYLRSRKK